MKIIEPSVDLIDNINPAEILAKLERCGRVSRACPNPKANPKNDDYVYVVTPVRT